MEKTSIFGKFNKKYYINDAIFDKKYGKASCKIQF